jgi:hypothetical protein
MTLVSAPVVVLASLGTRRTNSGFGLAGIV